MLNEGSLIHLGIKTYSYNPFLVEEKYELNNIKQISIV